MSIKAAIDYIERAIDELEESNESDYMDEQSVLLETRDRLILDLFDLEEEE